MDDLVAWLRQQLDADERIAKAATPGPWRYNLDKCWRKPGTAWFEEAVFAGPPGAEAICVAGTGETDDQQSMADAQHIARHDPARVLREVAAKRRIVEIMSGQIKVAVVLPVGHSEPSAIRASAVLQLLALPYSDRPGYREEWRP